MIIRETKDTMSQIYLDSLQIRKQVFVKEQHVPIELEVDQDEAHAIHFVLYEEEQPLATLRLLPIDEEKIKLQRMAVLKEARQKQLGKQLILFAEHFAKEQGFSFITLGAQQTAIPFYEKIGYHSEGEPFMDAGIPHLMMSKKMA